MSGDKVLFMYLDLQVHLDKFQVEYLWGFTLECASDPLFLPGIDLYFFIDYIFYCRSLCLKEESLP